jgi:hypothetical protein
MMLIDLNKSCIVNETQQLLEPGLADWMTRLKCQLHKVEKLKRFLDKRE